MSSSRPEPERSFSDDAFTQSEQTQEEQGDELLLSEAELRELYDQEEIERFLRLFSTYVNEVRVSEAPECVSLQNMDPLTDDRRTDDDGEWTNLSHGVSIPSLNPSSFSSATYCSLSEEIACRHLAPLLPPPRHPAPPLTFGRLRLALERLYLIVLSTYLPFLHNLIRLATWEKPMISSVYCAMYWTLWWYNFLFPALVSRIIFALFWTRIYPYPSLEDLRRHRMVLDEADAFGAEMTAKMSTSSVIKEMWRLFQLADRTMKMKVKKTSKGKEKVSNTSLNLLPEENIPRDQNMSNDLDGSQEEKDLKQYALYCLDEFVDLHERIRNIFIWRKPVASRRYGIVLSLILFISFLPAKYIAKLIFFSLGILFWHIVPIVAALPHSEKKRIPAPFSDVPTDAEYAMQLISQRVAAGLEVNPRKLTKKKAGSDSSKANAIRTTHSASPSEISLNATDSSRKVKLSDVKTLLPGRGHPVLSSWPPAHPLLTTVLSIAQPQVNMETHSYPCQHSSGPGLITLTQKTLFFTPVMSQNAKLIIPLSAVKGAKKAGLLKGIYIRWTNTADEVKEQKEEKFLWVGSRDDLFARLVGTEGRTWIRI